MIQVGDQLPKFEALQQDGKTVKSAVYQGKKLVIFFYPQAGTPTCTVEACNLGNHYQDLQNAGFQVIGVSPDSVAKQKKFQEKHQLPFDLIADTEHELVNKFGVWREKKTFGKTYMGTVRTTFVFDENSFCIRVIEKVQSKRAAEQILESYKSRSLYDERLLNGFDTKLYSSISLNSCACVHGVFFSVSHYSP